MRILKAAAATAVIAAATIAPASAATPACSNPNLPSVCGGGGTPWHPL